MTPWEPEGKEQLPAVPARSRHIAEAQTWEIILPCFILHSFLFLEIFYSSHPGQLLENPYLT